MNTQIATDPSQSKRLIDAGVDPKTADMAWGETMTGRSFVASQRWDEKFLNSSKSPAWSLTALLALLPKTIETYYSKGYFHLASVRDPDSDERIWEARWDFNGFLNNFAYDEEKKEYASFYDASPVESCVQAIEWLTSHGHSLNTPD